jgi:UDP-glucose 4-epimerase
MKALVTGAAGFIGSHLSERLVDAGATVIGIDCFTDYYPRPLKEGNLARLRQSPRFTLIEAPLAEAGLPALLQGVTHVFHLAAQAGVRKSWGRDFRVYTVNNIEATQLLLEACVGLPLERLVYASSSSIYGDDVPMPMREDARPQPVSPYGVTKLAAEQLCHLYHVNHRVPAVSVRYFTVYGPRQRPDMGFHRFFRAVLRGESVPLFGDGRQTRDFTFVADAVSATVAAATHGVPGGVYNIGGGSRVELLDVFELIRRVAARPLRLDRVDAQAGDMRDTYADTTRARADLGFAPTVTLEEGLRAQYEWMAALVDSGS